RPGAVGPGVTLVEFGMTASAPRTCCTPDRSRARGTGPSGVNRAQTPAELEPLQRCLQRGTPFGEESWVARTARQLGLEASLRPRRRPAREKAGPSTHTKTNFPLHFRPPSFFLPRPPRPQEGPPCSTLPLFRLSQVHRLASVRTPDNKVIT